MQFLSVSPRCRYLGSEVEISIAPSPPAAIGTIEMHLKWKYVNESNELPKKMTNQEYRSDTVSSNGRREI